MRVVILSLFIACSSSAFAQNAWLGIGTGFNSYYGLFGANLEVGPADQTSFRLGVGLGTWGTKVTGGLIFRRKVDGWGLGVGYLRSFGVNNVKANMETTSGQQQVSLNLLPASTINISAIKSWGIGKGSSRFCLELGYAIPIGSSTYYQVNNGVQLSSTGQRAMQILRPGGVVLGGMFLFPIAK